MLQDVEEQIPNWRVAKQDQKEFQHGCLAVGPRKANPTATSFPNRHCSQVMQCTADSRLMIN